MIEFDLTDWKHTFYLSGPMTGYPKYNYSAFERATNRLRGLGLKIISPHENPAPEQRMEEAPLWEYYMKLCKKQLEICTAIIMLRGWPESTGARLELEIMLKKEAPVFLYLENPGRLVRMSRR